MFYSVYRQKLKCETMGRKDTHNLRNTIISGEKKVKGG